MRCISNDTALGDFPWAGKWEHMGYVDDSALGNLGKWDFILLERTALHVCTFLRQSPSLVRAVVPNNWNRYPKQQ